MSFSLSAGSLVLNHFFVKYFQSTSKSIYPFSLCMCRKRNQRKQALSFKFFELFFSSCSNKVSLHYFHSEAQSINWLCILLIIFWFLLVRSTDIVIHFVHQHWNVPQKTFVYVVNCDCLEIGTYFLFGFHDLQCVEEWYKNYLLDCEGLKSAILLAYPLCEGNMKSL